MNINIVELKSQITIFTRCLPLPIAMTINARQNDFPTLTEPYLGQKPPRNVPVLFAPYIFTTMYDWYHSVIVFLPDGKEAYWQAGIYSQPVKAGIPVSLLINGHWT